MGFLDTIKAGIAEGKATWDNETQKQKEKEEQKQREEAEKQKEEAEKQKLISLKEYKRTCKRCGKVWYSSWGKENRTLNFIEKMLDDQGTASTIMKTGSAIFSGESENQVFAASAAALTYKELRENFVYKLRHCPDCGSGVCDEEILEYIP